MTAAFINKDGSEIARTKCTVYTRVMGYLRPVDHFNVWKKSEFYSRKYFNGPNAVNSDLNAKFNAWYNFVSTQQTVGVMSCGCA